VAIVAQNDLGFLLAIMLGIASTKNRFWAILAIVAGIAEMAFFALSINRTQGLVFISLALGARLLVRPDSPWKTLRPAVAVLAIVIAGVLYTGQAVRNAVYKDLQAFLDQTWPVLPISSGVPAPSGDPKGRRELLLESIEPVRLPGLGRLRTR